MTIPFKPFDDDDIPDPVEDDHVATPDTPAGSDLGGGHRASGGAGVTNETDETDEAGADVQLDEEATAAIAAAMTASAPKRGRSVLGSLAEGDETALGTAPTMSKAEAAGRNPEDRESSSGKSTPSSGSNGRRGKPLMGLAAIIVLAVLLAGVPMLRSAFQRTPKDRVGISYGGGPIEAIHFQKVVPPGHGLFFNGFFDSLYLYPSDQLNYILADTPDTDDAVVAPTSDRVTVTYQVAVYYRLNTDELQAFHEELGLRYRAYTDSGWKNLIRDTLRQQIESALQEETRRHTVADLYGDADLLVEVQNEVQATVSARLEAALGQRFFCGPTFSPGGECTNLTFIIKRTDIPESVAAAFESNKTSEVLIGTRENEVIQREQEAKGIAALAEALERSGPAYVLLKAIESGQINFWVLPDDGSIDITAPDGATPPTTE